MARIRRQDGMSLIELTVVLIVIGMLTSVAMKSMTQSLEASRRAKTQREMQALAKAIVGDNWQTPMAQSANFGYVGDIGAFPPDLGALIHNPGYATWHGPYVALPYADDTLGYRTDEWGTAYTYSGVTITSSGHGTPMTVKCGDTTTDFLANRYYGKIFDKNDSLPGAVKKDSVSVVITIPNGSGGTVTKTYHPDQTGEFQMDTLPVGQHQLKIIYQPMKDTMFREVTILPRHRSAASGVYKFAGAYFSGGGCSGSITLRPAAAGASTNLTTSGCANWQCVSETVADGDGSRVVRAANTWASDLYALPDPAALTCPPVRVTVWYRARMEQTSGGARPLIRIGGNTYNGAQVSLTASYADYSSSWTSNPAGGSWTWADINNLQAGIDLQGQNATKPAYCTQVWVVVDY